MISCIYTFFCIFLSFWGSNIFNSIYVFSTHVESIRATKNVISNLPLTPENVDSFKFLTIDFEHRLYAFQTENVNENKNMVDIIVWESEDQGEKWKDIKKIKCHLSNTPCEVMSTLVVNNKLVIIYGNEEKYSIAKYSYLSDWEISPMKDQTLSLKKAIYFSGNTFEIDIMNENPYILCYNLKNFIKNKNFTDNIFIATFACSFSYTEGKYWTKTYYMYIEENSELYRNLSEISQLMAHGNGYNMRFKIKTNNGKNTFIDCAYLSDDIMCFASKLGEIKQNPKDVLINMHDFSNNFVYIFKKDKAYIISVPVTHGFANDIVLPYDNDTSSKDIKFDIISTSESTLSIMYKDGQKMHVIYVEITKKRAGCEFIHDGKKLTDVNPELGLVHYNKNYSSRFLLNAKGTYECFLNHTQISSKEYVKWFYAIVPEDVYFENNDECFVHSFWNDDSNSDNNYYKTKVIKLSKLINKKKIDNQNRKEYIFYFPANFFKYFSDVDHVICYSEDKKYAIHYTFQNNFYLVMALIKPSREAPNAPNNFDLLNSDNSHWINVITSEPVGTYIINSKNVLNNYQRSTAIKKNGRQLIDQLVNENIKTYTIVTFPLATSYYSFEGIDLTNSSPYYKQYVKNINEDKNYVIIVDISPKGTTVGLVCPVNEETYPMLCFDSVMNENNEVVSIEKIHGTIPVFVVPKRMLYTKKKNVESLIEYTDNSYIELTKYNKPLSFYCHCKVNNYKISVRYLIKTEEMNVPSDYNPMDGNNNDIYHNLEEEEEEETHHNEEETHHNEEEIHHNEEEIHHNEEETPTDPKNNAFKTNTYDSITPPLNPSTTPNNIIDNIHLAGSITQCIFCSYISLFLFIYYFCLL